MTNVEQDGKIKVIKDVVAIRIPGGEEVTLPKGTEGLITQKLGGTYTLATDFGLVRVSSKNAEALGIDTKKDKDPALEKAQKLAQDGKLEEAIWEQLKQVFDPEIPINIVDLGLVYDCKLGKENNKKYDAEVKMTLTAPGCGMGPYIANDAKTKIEALEEVEQANVNLVWDPPWNQNMISEEGKMKLGMI